MLGGPSEGNGNPEALAVKVKACNTVFHTRRVQWPLFHILSHISKTLQVVDTSDISK